jgi:ABC-2 type transport system ATP-binding protein
MASVSRRFGEVTALRDVSIEIRAGTILGVVGPSGAGKTTFLRLLTGALQPTQGQVRVLGENPARHSRRVRRQIGYMPQALALMPELSAGENVNFAASLAGLLSPGRGRKVDQALKLVDLANVKGRQVRHLSGGMQRRVGLASALVHDPVMLFLDEPTAGIDPILRERVWDQLHRLREGRTIIVTTQYVSEAELCDYVALVAGGRMVAVGTPLQLRRLAMGGDLIQVETDGVFDAQAIARVPGVRRIRQYGLRQFDVVVDDAGSATPDLVSAITDAGGAVASTREARPSFDEVFTDLVAMVGSDAARDSE